MFWGIKEILLSGFLFTGSKPWYITMQKPKRSSLMLKIWIGAVKVNKKIEVDERNFNFGIFEEELYEVGLSVARYVLEQIAEYLDVKIREGRPKKALKNCGKAEKYLSTKMGDVRYSRTRYYDRESGGYRYLLDEALGLEQRQTVSIGRRQLEARLAITTGSYRSAVSELEASTGSTRSHEAIRGVVLEEGARIQKVQEYELQREYALEGAYTDEPHDTVYVEADGTQIHHQRSDRKKGKGLEVKVGICYTGKGRRYAGGSGAAKVLENKYIYLDIRSGPAFMRDLSLVAEREVGLSQAGHVLVGGDGAGWIRKGMEMNFGGAHYKLCEYHLNTQVTGALAGMDTLKRRVKSRLSKYDVAGALGALLEGGMRCSDHEQRERISQLYRYIESNREGIWDVSSLGDGEVGTAIERLGGVENNVDNAVAERFKKGGYRWGEVGARSLLKVEEVLLNGRFDQWWYEDRDKATGAVSRESLAPFSAAEVNKEDGTEGMVDEIPLPCFHGPDQGKPWVKALKGELEIKEL
jgi:hypothetical protein